ncbi:MAG: pentapeptide repeat-containing protein [Anaerolineae bacterium]|nr:pentapeptide repeat-containing protein [Anaerolineae bacterium]
MRQPTSGADLSEADLDGAALSKGNLRHAILTDERLAQGDQAIRIDLAHVKMLVAALMDAAAELVEVQVLGGKVAWSTLDSDMPKRKERHDGRRRAH